MTAPRLPRIGGLAHNHSSRAADGSENRTRIFRWMQI